MLPRLSSLAWLLVAVVALDVGTQGQRILNQSRALSLSPTRRSRANTAYVSFNFVGAAAGSLTAAGLWQLGGWTAVAATGASLCLLALCAHIAVHGLVKVPSPAPRPTRGPSISQVSQTADRPEGRLRAPTKNPA